MTSESDTRPRKPGFDNHSRTSEYTHAQAAIVVPPTTKLGKHRCTSHGTSSSSAVHAAATVVVAAQEKGGVDVFGEEVVEVDSFLQVEDEVIDVVDVDISVDIDEDVFNLCVFFSFLFSLVHGCPPTPRLMCRSGTDNLGVAASNVSTATVGSASRLTPGPLVPLNTLLSLVVRNSPFPGAFVIINMSFRLTGLSHSMRAGAADPHTQPLGAPHAVQHHRPCFLHSWHCPRFIPVSARTLPPISVTPRCLSHKLISLGCDLMKRSRRIRLRIASPPHRARVVRPAALHSRSVSSRGRCNSGAYLCTPQLGVPATHGWACQRCHHSR
jgi:hypothetical protein